MQEKATAPCPMCNAKGDVTKTTTDSGFVEKFNCPICHYATVNWGLITQEPKRTSINNGEVDASKR